jgi:Ca2+-binding EF-hand superfamily protein
MINFAKNRLMRSHSLGSAKSTRMLVAMLAGLTLILTASMAIARENPLDVLFQISDSDANGLISEAEWHATMQKRMESLDTNHDGNLSRVEFEKARQTVRERMRSMSPRARSDNQSME